MADIDPLQRLVGSIRATLTQKAGGANRSASGQGTQRQERAPARRALTPVELKAGIRSDLLALGPLAKDGRRREARKVFLQWVVLGELGFELAQSQSFQDVLRKIVETVEDQTSLTSDLDTAIDQIVGPN